MGLQKTHGFCSLPKMSRTNKSKTHDNNSEVSTFPLYFTYFSFWPFNQFPILLGNAQDLLRCRCNLCRSTGGLRYPGQPRCLPKAVWTFGPLGGHGREGRSGEPWHRRREAAFAVRGLYARLRTPLEHPRLRMLGVRCEVALEVDPGCHDRLGAQSIWLKFHGPIGSTPPDPPGILDRTISGGRFTLENNNDTPVLPSKLELSPGISWLG